MTYLSEVIADAPIHFYRLADPGGVICYDLGSTPYHLFAQVPQLAYTGPNSDGGSISSTGLGYPGDANPSASVTTPLSFEIICWGGLNYGSQVLIRYTGGSNDLGLEVNSPGTGWVIRNGAVPQSSAVDMGIQAWHHVVLTYDNTTFRLYVDGSQVYTTTSGNGSKTPTGGIQVGGGSGSRLFLSEAAIYASTLSASRVTAHYTAIDNLSSNPVNRIAVNAAGASIPGDLAAIRAAVIKSYP